MSLKVKQPHKGRFTTAPLIHRKKKPQGRIIQTLGLNAER